MSSWTLDKGDFENYRNRIVVADGEVEDENKGNYTFWGS